MSIDLLERGAAALGPLVEQVAFVGLLRADMVNQARAESVVLPRLRMLAGR